MEPIDSLSEELLIHIFSFLNLDSLIRCCLINNKFYRIVLDKEIWKKFGKRDYGDCYQKIYIGDSLKTYQLCFSLNLLKEKLKLNGSISNIYLQQDLLLDLNQTEKIDETLLILKNLKYLYVSDTINESKEKIIKKMNLVKIKKFCERQLRGSYIQMILMGGEIKIKGDDGQRLVNIENGLAGILLAC